MKHNPKIQSFHKQTYSSPGLNSYIPQNQMGNDKPSLKTTVLAKIDCFQSGLKQLLHHLYLLLEIPALSPTLAAFIQDQKTSKKGL